MSDQDPSIDVDSRSPGSSPTLGNDDELSFVEQKVNVHARLQDLHADELAQLSQNDRHTSVLHEKYHQLVWRTLMSYICFMRTTWWNVIWSLLSEEMTLLDRVSVVLFATGSSAIISILAIFCMLGHMPVLVNLYLRWAHMEKDDLSLVNATYPQLFDSMTAPQIAAARESLAESVSMSLNKVDVRIFDLDVAKFLLQCAALTYERTSTTPRKALRKAREISARNRAPVQAHAGKEAGQHATDVLGETGKQEMMNEVHQSTEETKIQAWAERMSPAIKYSTISELNSSDSAFCGLFYDPESTWIVLAFKGTSPTEFAEWASDFAYIPRKASEMIPHFGAVHGGFFDRLFPEEDMNRIPYDTISDAVRTVAAHLKGKHPDEDINVWFTGHSLGCAMASLAYARAVSESTDFGDHIRIRDAYLFAAPIVCDSKSVKAFNECLASTVTEVDPGFIRTMWRVTNRKDAVAVSLPSLGDDTTRRLTIEKNLFAFAHLGVELKMGQKGMPSYVVKGGGLNGDTWVGVHSKLDPEAMNATNSRRMWPVARWAQYIPLLGRLASHGTTMYWDSILDMEGGRVWWWTK